MDLKSSCFFYWFQLQLISFGLAYLGEQTRQDSLSHSLIPLIFTFSGVVTVNRKQKIKACTDPLHNQLPA